MSPLAAWIGLVLPLAVYVLIGIAAFRSPPRNALEFLYGLRFAQKPADLGWKRPVDRLLRSGSARRLIRTASLVAVNLSVVSALVYMIDGGSQQGWPVLLIPLSVLAGYYWVRGVL